MLLKKYIFSLAFVIICAPLIGQNSDASSNTHVDGQARLFYRSELYGGAFIHSNGWGVNFRKGYRKTGFTKRLLSIELLNMKHPKEYKIFSPFRDREDTKGFFFGKLNSLTILRPSYGHQKVLYSKEIKKGVQVSYVYFGGVSLGFVKPIYLEIAYPSVPNREQIVTERYDSEKHSIDQIFGRAPATRGLAETKIYPGLHGKFALNFEYAPLDDMIRAIETGVTLDAFHKEVPIMAFANNSQFYFTFYVNLQFGKKYL